MFPPAQRGIGWNWQVKGVADHSDASMSKWAFVRDQFLSAVWYYALCVVSLTAFGFGDALSKAALTRNEPVLQVMSTGLLGWMGAVWVWSRLCCAYSLGAMLGVATGVTDV